MYRRHSAAAHTSHHLLRATCMQILPLVEMYCRWVLEEDCSNLHDLMTRFDSEVELEAHELGRSLLFMIRHDDMGFEGLPRRDAPEASINPFADIRKRLAAVNSSIRDLHPQVRMHACSSSLSEPSRMGKVKLNMRWRVRPS